MEITNVSSWILFKELPDLHYFRSFKTLITFKNIFWNFTFEMPIYALNTYPLWFFPHKNERESIMGANLIRLLPFTFKILNIIIF